MADLLLKNHAPDAQGLVHRVTPESAGWSHVGFSLHRLKPGQSIAASTGEREACLVLVGGRAKVAAGGHDFGEVGVGHYLGVWDEGSGWGCCGWAVLDAYGDCEG